VTPKFEVNQLVWLKINQTPNQNRKIQSHWEGPVLITDIKDHTVWVKKDSGKVKQVNMDQIKPFQDSPLTKGTFNSQERPGQQAFLDSVNKALINQNAPVPTDQAQFLQRETQAKQLIKNLQANQDQLRPYLRRLYLAILTSQDPNLEALTPSEQLLYNRHAGWERSLLTSGDPLGIPEYRSGLFCKMPGPTPAAAPPQPPPPVGGPMGPPAVLPVPVGPPIPGTSVRGRTTRDPSRGRMPRRKRTVEPSDRRLRSSGPVEEPPPLPTRKNRTPSTQPIETTPSNPPVEETEAPGPSLMGRLTSLGRNLLFGSDDPSGGGPSAGVNCTKIQSNNDGVLATPAVTSPDPPEVLEVGWDSLGL